MSQPIIEQIKQLQLPYRGNCPKCGNHNTFSALLSDDNQIIFKCFHANCNLKGRIDNELSQDTIRDKYAGSGGITNDLGSDTISWIIPDHFTSPLQNTRSLAFMRRWGLLDKYVKGLELYYDPRQDRVVFPLRSHDGELLGCTGRALNYLSQPRWHIYQRIRSCPYIQDTKSRECIIVEDCVSCIRASSMCSAIALLSTNIPIAMYSYLQPYKQLFIALDPDALSKSISLQKELQLIKPTKILQLEDDIKYYNSEQMEKLRLCLD